MTRNPGAPNPPFLRMANPLRRTIVVGDVHGCLDELERLLEEVVFGPEDLLVSVGDLVDRGPEPWRVAAFFRDTPNAVSVLGNHDRRVAGTVRGTSKPAWTQEQTLSRIPGSEHAGWASWFESLPVVIESPHALVVHGRLDPERPFDGQAAYYACAVGGPAVHIDVDLEGVPLWFRDLESRGLATKPICIGHIGYARVELVPDRLYALDTGACAGGTLTAIVLPEGRIVSVPAAKNWMAIAREEWDASRKAAFDPWEVPWKDFIRLRSTPERSPSEDWVVAQVEEVVASLDVPRRLASLRQAIVARAGEPPRDGSARGEWFQGVARLLGQGASTGSLTRILAQPPDSTPPALSLFGVRSPGALRDALIALEEALEVRDIGADKGVGKEAAVQRPPVGAG